MVAPSGIRISVLILTALMLAAGGLRSGVLQPAPAKAAAAALTFGASADARVHLSDPDENFGDSRYLRAENGDDPAKVSYLRFGVSGINGAVTAARLRLYVTDGSDDGPALYRTSGAWTETGITWANRPRRTSGALDNEGTLRGGDWVEYDVTRLVSGNGTYNFLLYSSAANGTSFASRERDEKEPRLLVTMDGGADPYVYAVGDIACAPDARAFNGGKGTPAECAQERVGDIIDADPGADRVLLLGDVQYERGQYANFMKSYDPAFGGFKAKTRPSPGNHEYGTPGAKGYFDYFNGVDVFSGPAGDRDKGYYAYDIGRSWRAISLNTNDYDHSDGGTNRTERDCFFVACGTGSPQVKFLESELTAARSASKCAVVYWHHARWTSDARGGNAFTDALWRAAHQGGADVVLAGHDHFYERFAPLGLRGQPEEGGLRQFIVGTGGKNHYNPSNHLAAGSEVRNSDTFGVLKLVLRPAGYDWEFVPEAGRTFVDSGSSSCR